VEWRGYNGPDGGYNDPDTWFEEALVSKRIACKILDCSDAESVPAWMSLKLKVLVT
jgi:hypothetical protein